MPIKTNVGKSTTVPSDILYNGHKNTQWRGLQQCVHFNEPGAVQLDARSLPDNLGREDNILQDGIVDRGESAAGEGEKTHFNTEHVHTNLYNHVLI